MSRPANLENLRALADQLVWAIEEYVKAGIDDMKGDGWEATDRTLTDLGFCNAHDTATFPEETNLTCTVTAHANINEWGDWVELVDSGANTFTSKVASNDSHISSIVVEETESAGETWMIEISYGAAKTRCASMRLVSASVGVMPAIQSMRVRAEHIPAGETVYARLMCSKAGAETVKIHIRYHLHPA